MREKQLRIGRRAVLKNGILLLTVSSGNATRILAADRDQSMKIGLVTDLHFADKPAAGTRHYRETLDKFAEAGEQFRQVQPDFIVELGDFVDAADTVTAELAYLRKINREFAAACAQRHYVLGNHCVHTLTKDEFLDTVEKPKAYYSFDHSGFHFIVLDSCYRSDGTPYGRKNFQWTDPNIPPAELAWVEEDLQNTSQPTIVFAHQRLDVAHHYSVKNAAEVRRVLEDSEKVVAVFQGHSHKNDYQDIKGIHYCTLVAMVEGSGMQNNGYALMELSNNGTIRLRGFRKQADYRWS